MRTRVLPFLRAQANESTQMRPASMPRAALETHSQPERSRSLARFEQPNPLRMKRPKPVARLHTSLSLSCAALAAYIGTCACASHAETEAKGPLLLARASPLLEEPVSESLTPTEPAPAPRKQRRHGLDSYQIAEVVRSGYLAFGGCQALADDGQGREGVVTVDWLVRPDGSVSNVTVVDSSYQSAQVDDCVAAVAKGLRFPEAAGSTRVAWKVRFQALSASR